VIVHNEPVALMTPQEVAAFLSVPVATLRTWRTNGRGPRAHRVGKHLRYRHADVEEWLEQQAEPTTVAVGG